MLTLTVEIVNGNERKCHQQRFHVYIGDVEKAVWVHVGGETIENIENHH